MAPPDPLPLHSSTLSRVVLADMDPNLVEYYATLFSHLRPCIQIPISERDPFASREREVFGALYRQYAYAHGDGAGSEDISRLCVATHAVEHAHAPHSVGATAAGFSVTLANSSDLLRVVVWPKLLGRDPYGRRDWRADVLAPLSSSACVREVWLADVDLITDRWCDMPIWNFPDLAPVPGRGGLHENAKPAIALPALASVVIVHNCSSRLRLPGPPIVQPNIGVLPKTQRLGPGAAGPPPLEHLRLAIGYDCDRDLPRLRGAWSSNSALQGRVAAADSEISEPHRDGNSNSNLKLKVDLSTNLLRLLDEYAYVKHARLIVQLMPRLVLDADELGQLRGHFAAVEVEEIDRLPTVPVPERARDDVLDLDLGGFIPGSVLC